MNEKFTKKSKNKSFLETFVELFKKSIKIKNKIFFRSFSKIFKLF
jgi:hypothetical protein